MEHTHSTFNTFAIALFRSRRYKNEVNKLVIGSYENNIGIHDVVLGTDDD